MNSSKPQSATQKKKKQKKANKKTFCLNGARARDVAPTGRALLFLAIGASHDTGRRENVLLLSAPLVLKVRERDDND